jgi:hypothetical protein
MINRSQRRKAARKQAELIWRPLQGFDGTDLVMAVLDRVLRSWEDTPYGEQQQLKGVAVNCVLFVSGVSDEMRGTITPIRTLPPDHCLHDRDGTTAAMHQLAIACNAKLSHSKEIEPGDVLVVGPIGGGPGHAMIVGVRPGEIWHATKSGVTRTGLGIEGYELFGVFRVQDKAKWRSH